ncbi:MAG: hypothetical protein JWO13_1492 [Acidobacteriales bacterium]|nr:hypothetical protein [Terriglobales bacterium]
MTEAKPVGQEYLDDMRQMFRDYKKMAEKAMAQVSDEQLFYAPDAESNSIAVIVKHMAGNMRSRWTDFLTSDGEKPDRNRDGEFEATDEKSREWVMKTWEDGWKIFFDAVEPLQPADLAKTIYIRHQPHSVLQAINRQLAHYSSHIGQIVFLAKHIKSSDWETLSIARGKSADANQKMAEKYKK